LELYGDALSYKCVENRRMPDNKVDVQSLKIFAFDSEESTGSSKKLDCNSSFGSEEEMGGYEDVDFDNNLKEQLPFINSWLSNTTELE